MSDTCFHFFWTATGATEIHIKWIASHIPVHFKHSFNKYRCVLNHNCSVVPLTLNFPCFILKPDNIDFFPPKMISLY